MRKKETNNSLSNEKAQNVFKGAITLFGQIFEKFEFGEICICFVYQTFFEPF